MSPAPLLTRVHRGEVHVWLAWRGDSTEAELRALLARYLARSADALAFSAGSHGKPRLLGSELGFSLSHSGRVVAYALARDDVGVDVERIDPTFPWESVALDVFAPGELRRQRLDAAGMFSAWTRKEALLKAWGCGLAGPPLPHVPVLPPEGPPPGWAIVDVKCPPSYAAAVAHRAGPDRSVRRGWLSRLAEGRKGSSLDLDTTEIM